MENSFILYVLAMAVGYLLGSIPFGVLIARSRGVDIFKVGSGSPGATNVKRVIGKRAGNLVFALDFIKGVIAVGWPVVLFDGSFYVGLVALVAAVLGHSFSVFLRFRGGKGIATSMGGLSILMPWALSVGVILWLVIFFSTRYVSLASIVFGISIPITECFLDDTRGAIFGGMLALFILFTHRRNISRLLSGKELRFKQKN